MAKRRKPRPEDVALDSDIAWPQGLRDLKGANFTAQDMDRCGGREVFLGFQNDAFFLGGEIQSIPITEGDFTP